MAGTSHCYRRTESVHSPHFTFEATCTLSNDQTKQANTFYTRTHVCLHSCFPARCSRCVTREIWNPSPKAPLHKWFLYWLQTRGDINFASGVTQHKAALIGPAILWKSEVEVSLCHGTSGEIRSVSRAPPFPCALMFNPPKICLRNENDLQPLFRQVETVNCEAFSQAAGDC